MKKLTKFQKEKRCNKCKITKPAKDFTVHSKEHPFSLKSVCKKCSVEKTTNWIKRNKSKYNEYHRNYYNNKIKNGQKSI